MKYANFHKNWYKILIKEKNDVRKMCLKTEDECSTWKKWLDVF